MKAQRGYTEIVFPSEGAALRGRWYPPVDTPAPAVIMAHGLSATIPMVTDRYAEVLQAGGLGVLLYDHRNLGASDGEPRQEINPWIQARGYRDAISYVATLDAVDPERVALWGDSHSASAALVVAGVDDRPAAVVVQVPATGEVAAPQDPNGELAALVGRTLESGDVAGPEHTLGPLPVVSHDQLGSPSVLEPIQAYRWFIDYGGRFGTGWTNRVTLVLPVTPAPFHAGLVAHQVRCPVLMQVSPRDEISYADPQVAKSVYDSLAGARVWEEIDGGHFGLLHHPSDLFDQASAAQLQFLRDTLIG